MGSRGRDGEGVKEESEGGMGGSGREEEEMIRKLYQSSSSSFHQAMKDLGRRMSPDIKQIDMDVLRTFRDNIMYKDRYGIK